MSGVVVVIDASVGDRVPKGRRTVVEHYKERLQWSSESAAGCLKVAMNGSVIGNERL